MPERKTKMDIEKFDGPFRFLSNFFPARITHDGISFPTTEHAFQAAKTLDFHERWEVSLLGTPGKAKRAGRKLVLRPDWDAVKLSVMTELTILKFTHHAWLRERLIGTHGRELIEGNKWNDTFWGVCNGEGQNHLGKILMHVRDLFIDR